MTMQSSLRFFLHALTTHESVTTKIVLNRCSQIRLNKIPMCNNVAFNPDKMKHCTRHGKETQIAAGQRGAEIRRTAQQNVAKNRRYTVIPNTWPETHAKAISGVRIHSTAVTQSPFCSMQRCRGAYNTLRTRDACCSQQEPAASKSPRT